MALQALFSVHRIIPGTAVIVTLCDVSSGHTM
jgi:hypothetical protein